MEHDKDKDGCLAMIVTVVRQSWVRLKKQQQRTLNTAREVNSIKCLTFLLLSQAQQKG
jgi:hypothetical protein